MSEKQKVCAVILAVGSSSRMSSGDKTLAKLGSVPVAALSMLAFEHCDKIDGIILVTGAEKIEIFKKMARSYGISKLISVIEGGVCRQQSSYMGVLAAKDFSHVLIHDCARPLVDGKLISAVCAAAKEFGAAIPAVLVKDTIKTVSGDGFVVSTPKRSTLYSVQTPQGFDRELYFEAMKTYGGLLEDLTDDASLFEQAGYRVKTVTGSYKNIKITTDGDINLCKTLMKETSMTDIRTGMGYDVHRLVENRKLILGGVDIPHSLGLLGHSDADVLLHAISDSLLGAAALGDIGKHFPDTDPKFSGADSRILLRKVVSLIEAQGYKISNIDATIVAQKPKLAGFIPKMCQNIAEDCGLKLDRVSVKATTEEGLGFSGECLGIKAYSVCTLYK